ncbi:beta strand repeat-containing protein [Aeromonas rivipollensis]|uniref:beta strand repeat-containing protein n=1 Tax=Aeromonas rivipollensis TaxID=948519 RepID=UPI00372D0EE9
MSSVDGTATETVTITITGTNDVPVLAPLTAASITDTAANDIYPDITGTLAASDVDTTDTLTYGISGGVAGSYLSGAYDVAKTDTYGTLYVHSTSGDYRFVANAMAVEALTTGQNPTHNFTVTVTDDSGALNNIDTEILSLNLTGSNDGPTTAVVGLAAVAEDSGGRLITQAELLANANDVEGDSLMAVGLAISSGQGSLVDNLNGTWTYTPALNDDSSVSFSYTISDGDLSVGGSATLELTPVNDGPALAANPYAASNANVRDEFGTAAYGNNNGSANWVGNWSESNDSGGATGGDIQIIGGELRLGDDGSASITRTVNLSGANSATLSFDVREVGLSFGDEAFIRVSINGGSYSLVATVNGSTGTAQFSIDLEPFLPATTLTLQIEAEDYDNGDDFVYVDNVNIAYSVPTNPVFTEDGPGVVLDASANISDVELDAANNYSGATLTLARQGGANAEDLFGGSGLLALTAGDVVYNGISVGGYTQSGGTLAITFNANASSAVADGVLRAITYANTSDTPPASATVAIVFNDGNAGAQGSGGDLDAAASVTVKIVAVNDAPVFAASGGLLTIISNSGSGSVSFTEAALAAYFSDPEGSAIGINTVQESSGLDDASGTSLGAGNVGTAGTITIDDNGTLDGSFLVNATDGSASSATVSIAFDNNNTGTFTLSATGSGDSIIVADQSSDTTLNGGAGADYLIGNSGNDKLVGADNDKVLNGGNGTDTLQINAHFTSSSDSQIVNVESVVLTVAATLNLSNQSEGFTVSGSTGADSITGGSGGDRINGGSGNDTLMGGSGSDQFRLQTNGGNDTIVDYVDGTDEIAFLDNGSTGSGSVNFGNTSGDTDGNTLSGSDFDARASFAAIQSSDDNQVVRISAAGIASADILAADAGDDATNTYVIVFNDELDRGEIWFDTNWNDTANRVQVATLNNITTLAQLNAIDEDDIDVYSSPVVAPAGVAGSPINLALTEPTDAAGDLTVTVSGVPVGWSISGGTDNGDGSWTVVTDDPSSLTVTTAADFAGAMVLPVSMSWTNADGSEGHATLLDNVEAYAPGSPIFALSQDDNLSGSSGADTFVFAQPIAHNQVYGFDVAADRLDLIGFGAGLDFASLQIAGDGQGNAVITLGLDSSITLRGVDAGALGAANFVFDLAPEMSNSGTMILHDGAMLPLGGFLDNSGSLVLDSQGRDTRLEVLVEHLTLRGGGQVVLSDSPTNLIVGSTPQSRLVNENNTISGAGQLGGGQLMLANAGLILANGLHALLLDTGNNVIDNSGTLAATGAGGMTVASALDNSGHLWANGGDLRLLGDVTGGGSATIDGDATLAFGGAARLGSVAFHGDGAGTLAVEADDAMSLGTILGLEQEDGLLLSDLIFGADTRLSYSASADGTSGLLTVSDGTQSAALRLLGHYSEGDFLLAGEADGSVKVGYGGAASGTLIGTMEDDDLQGGAGNDILVGRAGSDLLHGSGGADTFAWLQGDLEAGKVTRDYVADFNQGEGDRLDLSDLLDQDGSQTMDSLKSLLSMVQETDGIHLQVQDTTTHQVAQDIVLMNHTFGSLTGDESSTASQVIDYMLSNHRLDIDNP